MAAGIASCCAVLSLPASSPAAVRFAEPAGVTVGSCTQSAPCDLQFAVETVAQPNDEVVVTPGTYALGAGNLAIGDSGLDLHGQAGRPRPLITSSAALSGVNVPVPATVRHLRIEFTGALYGINLAPGSGEARAEGLIVRASGAGACRLGNAAIRDSVCRANPAAPGTDALVMAGTGSSSNASATATNVTAVTGPTFTGSETYGIYVAAQSASLVLQGKNVIAGGVDGDVRVETSGSGSPSAAAFLIHSNFSAATGAGPGTEFLPVPGANGNQTAEPQFVDLAAGDFHQAPGSPTINAGTAGSGLGSTDLDGEPRVQGSAPDIGADEFTQAPPPPPPPPAVTAPPAEPPVVEPDRSAPGISGASLARRRFRVGTTLRFTLSEHAEVTLTLQHRQSGRRVRRHGKTRCVKPTRKLRRKRSCTRYTRAGTVAHSSPAGSTSLPFSRRFGPRMLRPGRYRLRLSAADPSGNRSGTTDLSLAILPPRGG